MPMPKIELSNVGTGTVLAASVAGAGLAVWYYYKTAATMPRVRCLDTPFSRAVLDKCDVLKKRFSPTPWAFNAHLQCALLLWREAYSPKLPYTTIDVEVPWDGGTFTLDVLEPSHATLWDRTLIVLPTLMGSGETLRWIIRQWAQLLKWRIIVVNRRGHTTQLSTPRFNTLGCTNDLRYAIGVVQKRFPRSELYMVGISAGSALLARYLGEVGANTPIKAAVAMCPAYNISMAFSRLHWLYDMALTSKLKAFFLGKNKDILSPRPGYDKLHESKSVAEFHEHLHYLSGHSSEEDYHENSCPMRTIDGLRIPIMVINTLDDPVCDEENVSDNWGLFHRTRDATLVLTDRGSHCAFFTGWMGQENWGATLTSQFLTAAATHVTLANVNAPPSPTGMSANDGKPLTQLSGLTFT